MFCFFFFKQKTAYEMRISDWSSDVCSSDLAFETAPEIHAIGLGNKNPFDFSFFPTDEKNAIASYGLLEQYLFEPDAAILKSGSFKLISERLHLRKIGRASCRERVCQYV